MNSTRQWKVEIYVTQREVSAIHAFLGHARKRLRDDVPLTMGVLRKLATLAEACKPPIVHYPGAD